MNKYVIAILLILMLVFVGCSKSPAKVVPPKEIMGSDIISSKGSDDSVKDSDSDLKTKITDEDTSEMVTPTKDESENTVKTSSDLNKLPDIPVGSIELIKEKLPGLNRVVVQPPTVVSQKGEYAVFGIGIYNVYTKPVKLRPVFSFNRAVDKNNNAIDTDKEIMKEWLITEFEDLEIASYETKIMPVHFKVKDKIHKLLDVKPGTYEFNIQFPEIDKYGDLENKYGEVSLFLRVEE